MHTHLPLSRPLLDLPLLRRYVLGFMLGDVSTLQAGYPYDAAVAAAVEYAQLHDGINAMRMDDIELSLLPCFALGVARGLGVGGATLAFLNKVKDPRSGSNDAIAAYHHGMICGAFHARSGNTAASPNPHQRFESDDTAPPRP